MRIILLALASLFLTFNTPLHAQDLIAPPSAAPVEPEIHDEYIQEAKGFEQFCTIENKMRRHYDCECLAAGFLNERIFLGPDVSRTTILSNIENTCQDASEAAYLQYESCLGNLFLLPRDINAEAYCSCYGNKFAEIFESKHLSPNPAVMSELQAMAHTACRKPGVAESMYEENR